MKARIVRIGNSQGIRIPKSLLEQTGLGEEVELEVRDGALVIHPLNQPRQTWDESFRRMAARADDLLLDADLATSSPWDEEEWEW